MKFRFAPSPTGYLHVGNARVALANWLVARKAAGTFVLRFDDTDVERSKPEYETAIEEDLRWLGLDWDESFRQMDRLPAYEAAAAKLKAAGRLYPCLESEEELRFKREQRQKQGRPPVYDRAALKMTPEQLERALANGKKPYWRFKLSTRIMEWHDGVLGRRQVKLPPISDPVLIRADGSFLYTFTSVVDDLETGVTGIIRGEDHVTNTGVQIDIMEALGMRPGQVDFAHLPLLTDADGSQLSKRIGSMGLRQLRRDGIEPAALAGYLAALGSSADPVAGMPAELVAGFSLEKLSRSSARFDPTQLLALNRRYLHGLSFEQVRHRLPEGADEAFWLAVRGNLDLLSEARDWFEIAKGQPEIASQPEETEFLRAALDCLPPEPWDENTWGSWTRALGAASGRKGKALFLPLRRALTGEEHGPELKLFLPLITRARVEQRLIQAAG
ncbi:glutamate--tRNA ligase [Roseomonas marmotae]|uniref:Glutamate--tRNA ligase n=1 Tax=Roseomonas marmotae TaxID=2768161 RepID=A0ABS3KHQ0_9PROT|nr:glutamate--tRNA ligase [Roseomonas marmotae]MBO1076475.1 glutamate--tRNA ligase [Roseomonas marmotae]QTI77925.1 glutamate--tRNA ligase [Roseomonas marmotae]